MDAQKIGQHIAALRKENGMTQLDLANKLNVTDKAISKWERGHGLPDIHSIEPLADALGVTIDEIMKGEAIPTEGPPQTTADTVGNTAAYIKVQQNLELRSTLLFAAGILLGLIGIPCAILSCMTIGAAIQLDNVVRVLCFLPLSAALILFVTAAFILIERSETAKQIIKAILLYLVYLTAVLIVFEFASVYHFGDVPTPMVLARLILFPLAFWIINLLLIHFLRTRHIGKM